MGFLIDNKHVITCAHIVSADDQDSKNAIFAPTRNPVCVTFPFLEKAPRYSAEVAYWAPPKEGICPEARDIAILRLKCSLPEGACAAYLINYLKDGSRFKAFGYPQRYEGLSAAWAYGEICDILGTGCFQIQSSRDRGIFVQGGFSGTPIWDIDNKGVVGMIVSAAEQDGIAHAIPIEELTKPWPDLESSIRSRTQIICNLPLPRNENFVGREEVLAAIQDAFESGQTSTRPQALVGVAGVGKTQVALEYAYRRKEQYSLIWWVQSDERATIVSAYAELADELNLPEKDSSDQITVATAVLRWFSTNVNWLLIFDNAPNLGAIVDFLPTSGQIIITARTRDWGGEIDTQELHVFNRDESIKLVNKLTGESNDTAAAALAAELQDLPLALTQAGIYCRNYNKPVSKYLEQYRRMYVRMPAHGDLQEYPVPIASFASATVEQALRGVSDACSAAPALLNFCAFLASDYIPRSLIERMVRDMSSDLSDARFSITDQRTKKVVLQMSPSPELINSLKDASNLQGCLDALMSYSLISIQDDSISFHQLPQNVVYDKLEREEKMWWAALAVITINEQFEEPNDPATWPMIERLLPHAFTATNHCLSYNLVLPATVELLTKEGEYLSICGKFGDARLALDRALAAQEALGPTNQYTANILSNLGNVYVHSNDYLRAKECYERALAINETAYGATHPSTGSILSDLGDVLIELHDYSHASQYYQRALDILRTRERTLELAEGPNEANLLDKLGLALLHLGDLGGAKKLFDGSLAIRKSLYGPDHLSVAWSLNNLGLVARQLGDLDSAEKLYERAVAIKEATYGHDPADVAATLANLGNALRALGELDSAKDMFERALVIFKINYGDDHLYVARILSDFGLVLRELGDLTGAKERYERALAIKESIYRTDHVDVAATEVNLAIVLRDLHEYFRAKQLLEHALSIQLATYGSRHPIVATTMGNLGALHAELGDLDVARKMLERALEIDEEIYGPSHPAIAQDLGNLAAVLSRLRDFDGAKELQERASRISRSLQMR